MRVRLRVVPLQVQRRLPAGPALPEVELGPGAGVPHLEAVREPADVLLGPVAPVQAMLAPRMRSWRN